MKNLTFTVTLSDFGLEIHLPSEARLLLLEQNNARFDLNNDELLSLIEKGKAIRRKKLENLAIFFCQIVFL